MRCSGVCFFTTPEPANPLFLDRQLTVGPPVPAILEEMTGSREDDWQSPLCCIHKNATETNGGGRVDAPSGTDWLEDGFSLRRLRVDKGSRPCQQLEGPALNRSEIPRHRAHLDSLRFNRQNPHGSTTGLCRRQAT